MKQIRSPVRLIAVGDMMLGDSSHFIGRGVGTSIKAHGADFLFDHVRNLLSQADLFLFNLESPLSFREGDNYQSKLYRASARVSEALKFGSVSIASLANNHILQHGPHILQETKDSLESAGLTCVGFSPDEGVDLSTVRVKVGNFTVSIHSESLIKDCTGEVKDYSKVEERIIASFSAKPADIRIVSLHWGDEFVPVPNPNQQRMARRLVDEGANLILGHHPHVLQPVEEYKGALIAYSLGNFISDQRWGTAVETGAILDIVLSPTVQEWKLYHTRINSAYQPELLSVHANGVEMFGNGKSQVSLEMSDAGYQSLLSAYSSRYRMQMKWELLRHFWKVSPDTWLILLKKFLRTVTNELPSY